MDSTDKRRRSEAARKEALAEKRRLEKARKEAVASSLRSIDSPGAQRTVFASDDEAESSEPKEKKMTLFNSDDEDNDTDGVFSNRHSGLKGEKLMKLESRYGNDPRFRLDDRFASDEEEIDDGGINSDDGQLLLKKEREEQQRILEKVLGKPLKPKPANEKPIKLECLRPFSRFDPLNPEHIQWMDTYMHSRLLRDRSEIESNKERQKILEREQQIALQNDKTKAEIGGQYYSLDPDFIKFLRRRARSDQIEEQDHDVKKALSFLKSIHEDKPILDEKKEDIQENDEVSILAKNEEIELTKAKVVAHINGLNHKAENVYKHSPLTDPLEEEGGPDPKEAELARKKESAELCFFINGDEPYVRSIVANYRRTQSVRKVLNFWSTYKESIKRIIKHSRRNARRNMKQRGLKYKYKNMHQKVEQKTT